MQRFYLVIFNKIYNCFTRHLNAQLKNYIVVLSVLILTSIQFFDGGKVNYQNREIIHAIILIIITLFSINGELRPVKWNKWVYYSFFIFGIGVLLIQLLHKTGNGLFIFAIELIILFPGLYFVWINRGDFNTLFNILSVSLIFEGVLNFVFCFLLSEQGKAFVVVNRFAGNAGGPNQFAVVGVGIFIAGIYTFFAYPNKLYGCIASPAGIGIGVSYVILSASRTAMLAEIVCVFASAIFILKTKILKKERSIAHLSYAILSVIILLLVVFMGTQFDNFYLRSVHNQQAISEDTVIDNENISSSIPEQNTTNILNRFSVDGDADALSNLSNGRFRVWKKMLHNIKPWGSPGYEFGEDNNTEAPFPAHNNFIEYLFRCGYIVGFIYLIHFIIVGICGLKLLFSRKCTENHLLFCIMCIGAFSVYAMLEVVYLPFIYTVSWIYYLSLSPVMCDRDPN